MVMQIYSKNNKNCFFSLISLPIFILFVLSDRARWGLQNLYTEFQNSLIMQIYATNLCKFIQNHKKYLFFICQLIFIWLLYLVELSLVRQASTTEFRNFAPFVNCNLCKLIQKEKKMLLLPHFLTDFDSVCFI